ncbi:MAG: MFS transporter [Bacteroidaceae bacterium]|nr:MFS transporter [Bacteroidaceae bacterium]
MKIKTGKGEISLVAMMGIWSIAALTSLPGLAVSPIMGDLSKIFPKVSELEIQMLTSLPSLLIIPSILFAGKVAEKVGYTKVLLVGLTLFFVSGVLYFFSNTINGLILISALLGVGAGMIIPLSTALVSRFFSGNYRTRQFGYVSAISNLTLVVATALTGYLADISWRLPFVVYLLPIVSIILLPQISHTESNDTQVDSHKSSDSSASSGGKINTVELLSNMWYYFLITYIVLIISLNLPFLFESYGYRSDAAGVLISLFFLAIMLPGLAIDFFKKYFGQGMHFWALVIMGAGIAMLLAFHTLPTKAFGCLVAGFGYGIAQPLIYDSTVAAASPSRASYALAWVMVMNYVAILTAPFIIDFVQNIFHAKSQQFPFIFNMIIAFIAAIIYLLARKRKG